MSNLALSVGDRTVVLQRMRQLCARIDELIAPRASGVYGIYLGSPGKLAPFAEGEDGLIYIGSSSNLAAREFDHHFSSDCTGFSTLRRSLGALLKERLELRAIPRASGKSESNIQNYRFLPEGETRLTDWMCEHLRITVFPATEYEEVERFLVSELRPLLNLTNWPNPNRAEIKRLRKLCADEARNSRHKALGGGSAE